MSASNIPTEPNPVEYTAPNMYTTPNPVFEYMGYRLEKQWRIYRGFRWFILALGLVQTGVIVASFKTTGTVTNQIAFQSFGVYLTCVMQWFETGWRMEGLVMRMEDGKKRAAEEGLIRNEKEGVNVGTCTEDRQMEWGDEKKKAALEV